MRWWCIIGALLGAASFGGHVAAADDEPAPLEARLSLDGDQVSTTFDVSTAFTEAFRKRVAGGLRSIAILEVQLLDTDGDVVAQGLRHCRFRYPPWADALAVEVRETHRRFERREQLIDRGLAACGQVQGLRLADLSSISKSGGYFLQVAVLLNPVDQETLQSAREFLSNPRQKQEGGSFSFFGWLARLFSSKPEAGGERFVFRSVAMPRPRRSS